MAPMLDDCLPPLSDLKYNKFHLIKVYYVFTYTTQFTHEKNNCQKKYTTKNLFSDII
jgi:hypothetical protein